MLHNFKRTTAIILCLVWYSILASAGSLSVQIDNLLSDPCLAHGIQGVVVKSVKTGEVLYERNPDTLMVPASNLKLFTSATALDLLGPDYKFTTKVFATTSKDVNGVIDGDLILQGNGDPMLVTADLTNLAQVVRDKGIKKITGDLVVDDSLFDNQRLGWGWAWDDLPYYYAAPVGALNLNRNVIDVYVYPGKSVGARAVIRTVPATDCVKVESAATTGSIDSEKTTWVYRKPGENTITAGGSIPFGTKVEKCEEPISVEDPAQYAGYVFRTELARQGVKVLGSIRASGTPEQASIIASHDSPPLGEIIKVMNKNSDNMIAETLLRAIGAAGSRKGATDAGIAQVMRFCNKIGIDQAEISMTDGSGLARRNFITANAMVVLLTNMFSHRYGTVYIDSFPIAGMDGTLRNRMKGTPAENHVRAKSGYVSNVSTLSGYTTTHSGDTLAFSILLNNHLCTNDEAKAVENKICEVLASAQ